jgi:hypothetical protein
VNSKKIFILLGIAALISIAAYFVLKPSESGSSLIVQVREGDFLVKVSTSGELRAKNQTDINAPAAEMREAQLYNGTKIQDLIAEGTVVKEGDFVAALDKSPLMTKLQEASVDVDKRMSELLQTKLDTALTLRDARDELLNLKSGVEEARLELEQSKFEAPAVQRQKELALERAKRSFEQKTENYQTKVAQAVTRVAIMNADLRKAQGAMDKISSLMAKMTIYAPKDGMVIYVKDWSGKKRTVNSMVSPWESKVATLPDLRDMQVVTYVNEVDIRKVQVAQQVDISLDSDPGKKLKGVVLQVANIGEQRPNQDSKVFEVVIDVLTKDTTLRPSMTTGNQIVVETYKSALYVPLEAVNNEKSASYVWKKSGVSYVKQEVLVGATNDQSALIYAGLTKDDEVYLTTPKDTAGVKLKRLESRPSKPKPFIDKSLKEKLKQHVDSAQPAKKDDKEDDGVIIIF